MKVRLTTLAENTLVAPSLLAEQGLSILIEAGPQRILLDVGQTWSVRHNAGVLGVRLPDLDKIVLSHGHFDHTGGLQTVLQGIGRPVEIVCHPDVWAPKYGVTREHPPRFVGIPFQQAALESMGARLSMSSGPVKLGEAIMTTGEVPMVTDIETIDAHLRVKDGPDFKQDQVLDDQAIIVDTGDGLVVILGCAHRGMINTLYHARELTGVDKFSLVVGGSHLIGSSEERVWGTIAALNELNVERLGLCHCTSLPVAAILAREFGDRFFFNGVGSRVEAGK
jgi:7,8-dihydropterin-6-yl-methyl-4-(beta-D-ribofuranosyl)aminobenzene 5'-phosphate synthase